MKLEIDIPEHHYNNIMAIDSVNLGRVPYKGIIMYTINAIKHGKVLEQEPTTKNNLGVDTVSRDAVKYYIQSHIHEIITESGIDKNAHTNGVLRALLNGVATMPSVTPIRPKGHWIDKQHLFGSCSAECSSCHKRSDGFVNDSGLSLEYKYYDFCPKCGAKMVEPQESEE